MRWLWTWTWLLAVLPAISQEKYSVKVLKDVPTVPSAHPATLLDLYLPEGAEDFPIFIFIHGGAWKTGDKSQYENIGRTIAGAGIATAVIEYPLGVRHPAHVRQAAAAFAWVDGHASEYGWDQDQIFVGGHSAGGQMAAMLTLDPQYLHELKIRMRQIRGCIVLDGVALDLDHARERPPLLLDMYTDAFGPPEGWHDASPMTWIKAESSPFLVMIGEKDDWISHVDTEKFVEQLKSKGTAVESVTIPGYDHFGMVTHIGEPGDPVAPKIIGFIRNPPPMP